MKEGVDYKFIDEVRHPSGHNRPARSRPVNRAGCPTPAIAEQAISSQNDDGETNLSVQSQKGWLKKAISISAIGLS
jgi:hypothetical protein